MAVTIPKELQKQVERHCKRLGVSEREYVERALSHFVAAGDSAGLRESGFDADLADELAAWDRASCEDFGAFAKRCKL